jgi:putative membrane protein
MTRRPLLLSGLGIATLACAWFLPLRQILPGSFSAHMTMHMAVVAVAAPLLALGVAGGPFDPVRRAPRLFPPIRASLIELFVVWVWHAPALHHAAGRSAAILVVEQASFLASGLFVWLAALGGDAHARANRAGNGIVALLLTAMHMTLLGALLALPPRPLYAHGDHSAHGTMSATLSEQHLGGAIMLIGGAVAYLAGGLWLTLEVLRRRPKTLEASRPAEDV